ncbi:Hsp70 family protein [Kibdelosporangium phytohabitans]|uniref:Uncharacterized protein n=1 Tax=Kibdelosporangium phytohabitans TaxID=860235 RepID=A0A0N9HZE3_9PSEU|nr:hypothetical protein [Kibdelosporangium phytohabitans]ALG12668.1 hypothetical protein AOZ06_42630 [Kibdelosporangium phytohabitans]MBE1464323.1 hypothetical protein [Kibdelosporangium phytohabitans]
MTAEARYVIGLDIGDGESCLGWAPLDRSEPTRIYARPRSGERSIVTAMAQSPSDAERRRLIGDEAVTSRGATHFSVSFKAVPDALSLETPAAVIFAQSLLTEFREHHPEVFQDGMAFVGHPTGWSPEAVAAYDRHLGLLGLPVRLMPESQSALLHVRDEGRDEKQLERVLVVDIGSSTTDFTIVEDHSPRNLPVGGTPGCRQIDEQLAGMVRAALHHDAALTEALAADGGPEFLLLACRWAREAQFSGSSRRIMDLCVSCEERFRPIVATAWTWLQGLEIPQMVAAPGGWGEDFRAVLTEVADLLGDRRPYLIVLTGGGSRMDLADRLCREVFPTSVVEQDEDPAFAVVRGLVSNAQHRANVGRFRRDVTELIRAPETEKKVRSEAAVALDNMKDKVAAQVAQVLKAGGSAASLAKHIEFGVFEAKRALEESLTYYLSMRVERICRRYGVSYRRKPLKLTLLPSVFTDQLGRILERAGKAERFTQHSMPAAAHDLLKLALDRLKGKFASTVGIASAIGAVASSGLVADRAARKWIQRKLRLGEYSPDELDKITAEVMAMITEQTNDGARELERWLA